MINSQFEYLTGLIPSKLTEKFKSNKEGGVKKNR